MLFKEIKKYFLNNSFKLKDLQNTIYNNVFYISNLGQLKQVESYIALNNLENNLLLIAYTDKNTVIPTKIEEQANKKYFNLILRFKLPNNPNNLNQPLKLIYYYKNYKKFIRHVKFNSLYALSFEGHYSIFLNMLYKKKYNINLLEEGLGTYKNNIINNKITCKPTSVVFNKFNVVAIITNLIFKDYLYFYNFNKVSVAFPDHDNIKKIYINSKIEYYFCHYNFDIKNSLLDKYNINHNDFIYVSQRFGINDEEYAEKCINILETLLQFNTNSKIYIKFHPKEQNILIEIFNKYINNQNIIIIEESDFLVETIIYHKKPKAIIGLSSTSLIYSQLIHPTIKSISITPIIAQELSNKNNLKTLLEHYNFIIENFSSFLIPIYNINDFQKINSFTPKYNQYKIKKELYKAYQQKLYLKYIVLHDTYKLDVDKYYLYSLYKNNNTQKLLQLSNKHKIAQQYIVTIFLRTQQFNLINSIMLKTKIIDFLKTNFINKNNYKGIRQIIKYKVKFNLNYQEELEYILLTNIKKNKLNNIFTILNLPLTKNQLNLIFQLLNNNQEKINIRLFNQAYKIAKVYQLEETKIFLDFFYYYTKQNNQIGNKEIKNFSLNLYTNDIKPELKKRLNFIVDFHNKLDQSGNININILRNNFYHLIYKIKRFTQNKNYEEALMLINQLYTLEDLLYCQFLDKEYFTCLYNLGILHIAKYDLSFYSKLFNKLLLNNFHLFTEKELKYMKSSSFIELINYNTFLLGYTLKILKDNDANFK